LWWALTAPWPDLDGACRGGPALPMASGGGCAARVINSRGQHVAAMSGLGLGLTHSREAKMILNLMHSPLQSRKQV